MHGTGLLATQETINVKLWQEAVQYANTKDWTVTQTTAVLV